MEPGGRGMDGGAMSKWYEIPYPTNPHPPSAKFPRQVSVGSPNGPDVEAYKRAVSRLGRWPWKEGGDFSEVYSSEFAYGQSGNVGDTGMKGFQRQMKLTQDGIVGSATFEALRKALIPKELQNGGQPAFDSYCLNLLKEASSSGSPSLTDYCKRCFSNEPSIHYSQNRPMTHLGTKPENGFTCDCSGHSTGCYYWVGWKDPNKSNYNGYGWTGTLVNNPSASPPYQIGDLALYGSSVSNTTHVVTCYLAGDASTSAWASHGSESGPYPVDLHYRSDLVKVVRPAK